MAEIANFIDGVATIHVTPDEVLEVQKLPNGTFRLIVHNRQHEGDNWDDLSVTLKAQQFSVLGSIANVPGECDCGAPKHGSG